MSFGERFRTSKTSDYLTRHRITVHENNFPKKGGPFIFVSTHPTIDETKIYRAIDPKAPHLVHVEATKRTNVTLLDEALAVNVSGIIPVYSGDKNKRARTYKMARRQLENGRSIFLNPTGKTARTMKLPKADEIIIGGLYRILQETNYKYPIIPVVVQIDDSNITESGSIADGSIVTVKFGDKLQLTNEINPNMLKQQILDSWRTLITGVQIG